MKYNRYILALTFATLGLGALGSSCHDGPTFPEEPLDPGPKFGVWGPTWNHSGTAISYHRFLDSNLNIDPGLYLMTPDGEHLDVFRVVGTSHRWFPGDSEFIYNTGGALGAELFIHNINTQESRATGIITFSPPFDLSQDGQKVYYEDETINNLWSTTIYEQRLGDTARRAIADGELPVVSTDGRFLAYHRRELYIYDLEQNTERKLLDFGWPRGWSSSSQELIASTGTDIFVVATTTGFVQRLSEGLNAGHISPVNNLIVFERQRGREDLASNIWIIGINGQGLKRLVPLE